MAAVSEPSIRSCTSSLNGSLHSLSIDSMSDSLDPDDLVNSNMSARDRAIEEMRNLHLMIEVTTDSLKSLNNKFGSLRDPPQLYLKEFEDLNTKLFGFQEKLSLLQRCNPGLTNGLFPKNQVRPPPISVVPQPPVAGTRTSASHSSVPPLSQVTAARVRPLVASVLPSTTGSSGLGESSSGSTSGNGSPSTSYPSLSSSAPLSANSVSSTSGSALPTPTFVLGRGKMIQADLPNDQKSTVEAMKGRTVRETLQKKLQHRQLTPEVCIVFKIDPATKRRIKMNWDDDMGNIEGDRIVVEEKIAWGKTRTTLSHNIQHKTFFTTTSCDHCHKRLFNGFRCQRCDFKFHQRCENDIPKLCKPIQPLYQHAAHMLAGDRSNGEPIYKAIFPIGAATVEDLDTFPRKRSTSAPDVNRVNIPDDVELPPLLPKLQRTRPPISPAATSGMFTWQTFQPPYVRGPPFSELIAAEYSASQFLLQGEAAGTTVRATGIPAKSTGDPTTPPSCLSVDSMESPPPSRRNASADGSGGNRSNKIQRESMEDWEIPAEELYCDLKVGSGSFGTVYHGFWYGDVAVKRLLVSNPTMEQLQAFKNEVAVLRKTRHNNIVLFMGCVSKSLQPGQPPQLAIVTQWCAGRSLYKKIHVEEFRFEMKQLIEILRQISQGMSYLHAKSIIHRDLKSNNIFLSEDQSVRIGDFGLATVKTRWTGSHQQARQITGSILWMAPEVIRMDKDDIAPFSTKSDVYSFGVVMYELLCGKLPYEGLGRDMILYRVGRGFLRPTLDAAIYEVPKSLSCLFEACVRLKREDRLEFTQVYDQLRITLDSIPAIRRSNSEPTLNRNQWQSDDFTAYNCPSPKTPAVHMTNINESKFPFLVDNQ
ncbi:Serine/threonine-protein kinase B-raf [Hypsibius exemplaris]|uniref:non-specific serine/threonine protein kinase n=1 Tax=Hypsibius exemplaris TaxID=2072580 RepID=A0A1W0WUM9_HYPEX|nr:Serine/threonine-protein kinase B-raf [Hypsibius exemplaris]